MPVQRSMHCKTTPSVASKLSRIGVCFMSGAIRILENNTWHGPQALTSIELSYAWWNRRTNTRLSACNYLQSKIPSMTSVTKLIGWRRPISRFKCICCYIGHRNGPITVALAISRNNTNIGSHVKQVSHVHVQRCLMTIGLMYSISSQ